MKAGRVSGFPHIVYGGDFLYRAWHDGTTWHLETVDGSTSLVSIVTPCSPSNSYDPASARAVAIMAVTSDLLGRRPDTTTCSSMTNPGVIRMS